MTKGQLEKLAAKFGATVEEDKGAWHDIRVMAPKGRVWSSDFIHELVGGTNVGPASWAHEARADIAARMLCGLTFCEAAKTGTCEWCNDYEAEVE